MISEPVLSTRDRTARTHLSAWTWTILWSVALGIRLPSALLLPNAEQDAYSYVETIAQMSANLSHFRLADLYGFWLPLFQFTAAIPNVWIDNPLLVGKILSGLCGAMSCVLVFAITEKLTRNLVFACLTFALVVCNPLHILYSAASMTDVPHACLVLASLWFLLQERWIGAAIFAAIAESVRIESWSLIVLLPLLQFFRQRRVSLAILGILLLPPLGWLLICRFVTGDPFAFFAEHARYHASYLDFYPTRRDFVFADINRDAIYLLLGANQVVFFATFARQWLTDLAGDPATTAALLVRGIQRRLRARILRISRFCLCHEASTRYSATLWINFFCAGPSLVSVAAPAAHHALEAGLAGQVRCYCRHRLLFLAIEATNARHLQSARRFSRASTSGEYHRDGISRIAGQRLRVAFLMTSPFGFCLTCHPSVLCGPP